MSPQEFEVGLHDAEVKLARLKALYEQWFQGIEKLEPSVPRKELDRSLEVLKKNVPRNTALRFRMQQLVARYGTYGIYWGRTSRQIEEGTYRRDIVRAQRKQAPKEKRPAALAFEVDVDVEIDDLPEDKTDPGLVAKVPSTTRPRSGDLDSILNTLAPPADDAGKMRSARPLSPFAMGAARAAPGGASATFGKPKDKPANAAATIALPTAAPAPAPAQVSVIAPKPVIAPPKPVVAPPAIARPAPPAPAARVPPPAPMMPKPPPPPPSTGTVPKVAAAPPTPPAPRPAAPTPANGNLDDGQMRAIYSRYVDARKQNNERTDVRYESLAESVQKMMPKLREKHAGKAIDFEIVLQNGKVGLKPKVGG